MIYIESDLLLSDWWPGKKKIRHWIHRVSTRKEPDDVRWLSRKPRWSGDPTTPTRSDASGALSTGVQSPIPVIAKQINRYIWHSKSSN